MTLTNTYKTFTAILMLISLMFLFVTPPALAGKTFDNRDIKGEYKYSLNEAQWDTQGEPPVRKITFCVSTGTAIADGEGNLQTLGFVRCSSDGVVTTETTSGSVMYEVQPNGEVLFYDDDLLDPTHGVIVDRGRTLLIDSTLRTDPDMIYQVGSASKQ